MIPALLAALQFAPAVLSAGRAAYNAIASEDQQLPIDAGPDTTAAAIGGLPEAQRVEVFAHVLDVKARVQELDTRRFVSMNDGDAEKIRASARPEIARRAMGVIETVVWVFKVTFLATIFEAALRFLFQASGKAWPDGVSIWSLFAAAAPVTDLIWPQLVGVIAASVMVITKYMGCRERDKAQEFELQAGRPLQSAEAVATAAGGAIGAIVRAVRGK